MICLLIFLLAAGCWLWGYTQPLQRFSSHLVMVKKMVTWTRPRGQKETRTRGHVTWGQHCDLSAEDTSSSSAIFLANQSLLCRCKLQTWFGDLGDSFNYSFRSGAENINPLKRPLQASTPAPLNVLEFTMLIQTWPSFRGCGATLEAGAGGRFLSPSRLIILGTRHILDRMQVTPSSRNDP